MVNILNLLHGTRKRNKHSNDLGTLVSRHYQNGDSLREIAAKNITSSIYSSIYGRQV